MMPTARTPEETHEKIRGLRSTDRTVLFGTVACCCLAVLVVVATAFVPSPATITASAICVLSAVALVPFCWHVRSNLRHVLDDLIAELADQAERGGTA